MRRSDRPAGICAIGLRRSSRPHSSMAAR
jgi:hypothetical protein